MADAAPAPPLLLASTSPRRIAILEQLGIPFDVIAPRYEEQPVQGVDAVELVRTHARAREGALGCARRGRPSGPRRRHRRRAHLARDGGEHAIKLLDALNAPWTLVDAAWTPKQPAGVRSRKRKRWLSRDEAEAL